MNIYINKNNNNHRSISITLLIIQIIVASFYFFQIIPAHAEDTFLSHRATNDTTTYQTKSITIKLNGWVQYPDFSLGPDPDYPESDRAATLKWSFVSGDTILVSHIRS